MTRISVKRRAALVGLGATALEGLLAAPVRALNQHDVIVIGAGLSGLHAAHLMQEEGLDVQVIEGRHRVGGRILTLDNIPGNPEAGGNGIAAGYGRVIDAAERFGTPLINIADRARLITHRELVLDHKLIPRDQWPNHPRNILPESHKEIMPWSFTPVFVIQNNPLVSYADWIAPESERLDIPLYDWMVENGLTDEQIDLAYHINTDFGNSAHDVSALMLFFVYSWGMMQRSVKPRGTYAAKGGNQRIPEAMAAALNNEVHLGREVVGMRSESGGAEVHCADGTIYRAKRVVCSIPVAVLRKIKMDPRPSGIQAKGIHMLGRQKLTQSHIVAKAPYWEEDGFGPGMFADSIAGNVMAQYFGDNPNELTSLIAWHKGYKAERLDQLPEKDAKAMVISDLERIRPAAKGKLEVAGFKSWYNDPFSAGDWAVWEPGQITEFHKALARPHGRIHFCGEHTSVANRGMEGAMESGERVAFEVFDVI